MLHLAVLATSEAGEYMWRRAAAVNVANYAAYGREASGKIPPSLTGKYTNDGRPLDMALVERDRFTEAQGERWGNTGWGNVG
jgi:hypothetical protein